MSFMSSINLLPEADIEVLGDWFVEVLLICFDVL
jgi:hypothetical protein